MRVYLSGTVTGIDPNRSIDQSYRKTLTEIIKNKYPQVEIDNPIDDYADGQEYDYDEACAAFCDCVQRARTADLVVCYLDQVSMGSAVEMFAAYKTEVPVIVIAPENLVRNWVITYCMTYYCESIERFRINIERGVYKKIFNREEK